MVCVNVTCRDALPGWAEPRTTSQWSSQEEVGLLSPFPIGGAEAQGNDGAHQHPSAYRRMSWDVTPEPCSLPARFLIFPSLPDPWGQDGEVTGRAGCILSQCKEELKSTHAGWWWGDQAHASISPFYLASRDMVQGRVAESLWPARPLQEEV